VIKYLLLKILKNIISAELESIIVQPFYILWQKGSKEIY